jgi:ATP-dependent Clp protease ATP-binding subunit ClpA
MNKYLPDKAIDLIDEASARISTLSAKLEKNDEYVKVEKQIAAVHKKIEKAIEKQDYFKAAEHKETEEALKQKLIDLKQKSTLPKHLRPVVTKEHIGTVLSEKL